MANNFHGQTRSSMEPLADPDQMRALDRAEKTAGMQTGMRKLGDRMVMVTVTFYPKTVFWVHDVVSMSPDYQYGPHRELTKEEWERTSSLF